MIVVRMIGGLGNQMFQYAAARALADKTGHEVVLDTRPFVHYSLHAFMLDRLKVRARVGTSSELRKWPGWLVRPSKVARRLGVRTRYYSEPRFSYDPGWPETTAPCYLDGYFQSERYFLPVHAALLDDFVPRAPLTTANAALADSMRDCESVMIHVRRGDYVNNAVTLKIHGVCSVNYYRSAIAAVRDRVPRPRFFIFSNDLAWARTHLPIKDDAVFIDGNQDFPEIDIHLMAQCRHHIIANSSFSWWGAWLARTPGQVVVAPRPWFDSTKLDATDLVPARWLVAPK